ncbi:similar to Saccharomyces cerevisiae YBR096W Putative protein of unknown function [Maudiozyma saulgeensis]|uniref:Thioesterase domain-containing protein n=1 Tax=Maudiozyma saulgeensis TaxID=1789683 RepID=A0A1X7R897_9SACH|nr:similar to Saccharomyces cerevisiae YBR096W Putative protein of unknown function [Kazachstania saulgeensis]
MRLTCTILKWFLGFYLVSSYKSVPGAYFVRFYAAIFPLLLGPLITGKKNTENIKKLQKNEMSALGYVKYKTYASPMECDFYLHKNNATYFTELDISRGELMTKLLQKIFLDSPKYPYIPVANVFTNFLKEIKPFESYTVSSNILCWDEKWIYVASRFMKKNDTILCSFSLTKYVVKDGRKTIPPKDVFEFCGIYNEKVEKIAKENYKILSENSGFHDTTLLEQIKYDYLPL